MESDESSDPASGQSAPARLQGPVVQNRITRAFSLQSDPFTAQHDPRFIVGSKPMRQALARLRKCLEKRCGLILITGEAGIGKTVLLDAIQRDSRGDGRMARIDDPTRGWAEIGQEIGAQLDLAGGRLSPGAVVTERGHGRTLRIFIDSAQCLPEDSLNHLKAYLDLKAPAGKDLHQLQIVLLARNSAPAPVFGWLRELEHQRIGFERLDSAESRRYVQRRLRVAAGEERRIFSEDALERVAQVTDGLPGAINQMCHVALDMAASRELSNIDSQLVEEVYQRLQESRARRGAAAATADAVAGAAVSQEAGSSSLDSAVAGPPSANGHSLFSDDDDTASQGRNVPGHAACEATGVAGNGHGAASQGGSLLMDEFDEPSDAAGYGSVVTHTPKRSRWNPFVVSALVGALALLLLLGLWKGGFGVSDEPEAPLPVAVIEPTPAPEPPVEVVVVEELGEPEIEEGVELVEPPPVEELVLALPEPQPALVPEPAPKPAPKPVKVARTPRPRRTEPAVVAKVAPRPKTPTRLPPPQPVASIPAAPPQEKPAAPPVTLSASEVLERCFARFYESGQTRTVELFEHADSGERPIEVFKLARKQLRGRTLSLGVLVGSGDREEQRILSIETGEADDKRFAYLPGPKQTVSLTESRNVEPFEGTHFRYDDFRPVSLERYYVYGQERSEGADGQFTLVSAKPRYRAPYSRVEFLIDTSDYTLLERHYYRGRGLRPYRIVQTPRKNMRSVGKQVVPMRLIARDLKTGRIAEARVVEFDLDDDLDKRLFTLGRIQRADFQVPGF